MAEIVKLKHFFGEKGLEEIFNLATTALSEGNRVNLSRDEFEYLLVMKSGNFYNKIVRDDDLCK